MKSGQTLRAGIIGLGVGERHIYGYSMDPRCQVAAVCDKDIEKIKKIESLYPSISATLEPTDILYDPDIDVVSIASYDDSHCDLVIEALNNGKHCFVEKPLCLTSDEYFKIAKAYMKQSHLKLSSNLVLRKAPRFIELRRRIKRLDLGQIYYLEGDYDYGRLSKITNGWRADVENYSVMHGGGIHLIDLLMWLSGDKVAEVFAYGNRICSKNSRFKYDDMVIATLKFSSGLLAKISANYGSVTPHHHKVCVYGTNGAFLQSHCDAVYSSSRDPDSNFEKVVDEYPGVGKGDMLPAFVRSILDSSPPDVSAKDVFDSMAVSLAIQRSLSENLPVPVDYLQAD